MQIPERRINAGRSVWMVYVDGLVKLAKCDAKQVARCRLVLASRDI